MAVGILSGRPVAQEQKEDPLDKIAKGLNIAQSVFGIATNIDTLSKNKQIRDSQLKEQTAKEALVPMQQEASQLELSLKKQKELEGTQEQQGILTPRQAAGLGTIHSQQVPGSYAIKLSSSPDQVQYLLPRSEAQLQAAKITASSALEEKKTKRGEELAKRKIEGFQLKEGFVPSDDDIKKIKETAISGRSIINETKKLEDLVDKYGVQVTGPIADQMQAKIKKIILGVKNIEGLGQLSQSDLELATSQIPDITGFKAFLKKATGLSSEENFKTLFQGFNQSALDRMDIEADQRGYSRVSDFGLGGIQKPPNDDRAAKEALLKKLIGK